MFIAIPNTYRRLDLSMNIIPRDKLFVGILYRYRYYMKSKGNTAVAVKLKSLT